MNVNDVRRRVVCSGQLKHEPVTMTRCYACQFNWERDYVRRSRLAQTAQIPDEPGAPYAPNVKRTPRRCSPASTEDDYEMGELAGLF